MANIRLIKRRISSAKNIAQITKAMELVAASKMKKAQAQALAGKLYAQKIYEVMMRLARRVDLSIYPLLKKPNIPTGKSLIVTITTNKGLCGGLNTSLFRFMTREFGQINRHIYVTLGKKALSFLTQSGSTVVADFSQTFPPIDAVPAVVALITKEYLSGVYDSVELVYNEFMSALSQIPRKKTLLPLTLSVNKADIVNHEPQEGEMIIEPSIPEVFDALLPHYVENQLRDAILQAQASEHSARMIAMRNATDNALSFVSELTLVYNKARQEKITYEISDMVTARLAVEV